MFEMDEMRSPGANVEPQHSREGRLQRIISQISQIDEQDARSRYREETRDENVADDCHGITSSEEVRKFVAFEPDDPENPYNWTGRKKASIVVTTMATVVNSTMASSLPSNAIPYMMEEWHVNSTSQQVLPISMFLVGYVFGPIMWAPLSEQFGRKRFTIATFVVFSLWTLACALAPNWPAFLVFRLFVGAFASAPIAVVTGILADIYNEPQARGRAMAVFMATTVFGPLLAPIISGYCSPNIGWRWTFWIGLIYAGATLIPLLLLLPETSGPIILVQRARKLRRQDPDSTVVAPHELEQLDLRQLAARVLTRPVRMLFTELIVSATCVYLALCYAIFYMTFQAFPIIYEDLYGLSAGVEGLCFLAIGGGALCALPVFFGWDAYLRRALAEDRPWTRREEYRRLPLACLGGPLFVVSLFWLGWTSREGVPFFVPMLSGIPFGMGFQLIFMALLNYLTDAYEIYAASANAAASCSRSLLATVLPFAATPMFNRLGIDGACSLLGGLSCLMCVIPFVFIWKGERLRAGSRFYAEPLSPGVISGREVRVDRNA
ncbi:MFS general substrate transporter [Cryphonectria parasitica EP155]|uniref:MFS general substrate transporter n=1 Tax=Cryphonectria parasitica (strain ATCC 38755 / EP155) TaxID=660469 RepID=A0A9P5CPH5_CRYP1|nr:MFS general substrate transporter [Cryphonectria parasitica EP155]KAF3766489.1 MFS general substrate transporter [Cryphonectria parasitica EP155]